MESIEMRIKSRSTHDSDVEDITQVDQVAVAEPHTTESDACEMEIAKPGFPQVEQSINIINKQRKREEEATRRLRSRTDHDSDVEDITPVDQVTVAEPHTTESDACEMEIAKPGFPQVEQPTFANNVSQLVHEGGVEPSAGFTAPVTSLLNNVMDQRVVQPIPPQSKMSSPRTPCMAPTQQTSCSQLSFFRIRASSPVQINLMDMVQYTEGLKGFKVEVEERLKCLEAEQKQTEQEISTLQASLEPLGLPFPELRSKESMMKEIEEKHHGTALSVFCCLYREAPPPQSYFLSKKGVFGIVALLGSVASTSLSRVLSAYLGRDEMLALVCKSSQCGPSAEYLKLKSEAERLGISISKRFSVLYLDKIRPWKDGLLENDDPQRKLAMDDPKLPDGDPIPGFKGYAVNMIDLAPHALHIQTDSGHGLRETLFYGLFGNLQVYETHKHVEAALPHINRSGGAASLDGFIVTGNRYIYPGCRTPEIHFPITLTENEETVLRKLEAKRDIVTLAAMKIVEEKRSLRKVEKKLKKEKERYENVIKLCKEYH